MLKIATLIFFLISSVVFADTLEKIEISGNKRIPENTIKMFSNVSIGDKIENIDVNSVLKNLYDTNFFKDIVIDLNENTLKINVLEFPIVQNVNIEGIKSKKINEEILDNIFFKERSSFNEIFLNDDRINLEKILKKNGYYFPKIQTSIENLEDNKINLNYVFDLGEKSKIRKITFLGKKYLDKKLKSVILTEEYKFWKIISGKNI